jgi:hypothetical protein
MFDHPIEASFLLAFGQVDLPKRAMHLYFPVLLIQQVLILHLENIVNFL